MHSAKHVYEVIEKAGTIAGSEIVHRLPMFARSTVFWKLRLLVRCGAVKQDGAMTTKATFSIAAPLDMTQVRKMVRELNLANKGSGRGEGKRLAAESLERRKQRDEAGMTERIVSEDSSRPARRKPKVDAVQGMAQQSFAWPVMAAVEASDAVQRAVDAVLDVPLRDAPRLRQRLKEVLG